MSYSRIVEVTFALVVFLFGLLIGSFINVLVLRFGFHEAKRARSGCQACGAQLTWYELVPVVSYFILRGKCRSCGSKIALQYPLVELGVGALFLLAYLAALPITAGAEMVSVAIVFIFWASFVALVVYDIRHTLLPTAFVIPLLIAALLVRVSEALMFGTMVPLYDALLGAVISGIIILLIVLVTRGKGMGLGDAYIAGILGVFFGAARSIEVLILAFWIGAVVGIVLLALKKGFKMKTEVPFVPFLFVASLVGAYTTLSPLLLVGFFTHALWPF